MNIKHVALAATITATVSISALSLSLIHPASGHAEDTPAPTIQAYTAPDVTVPSTPRDTVTVTPAPTPTVAPTPEPVVGNDPAPVIPPTPGSAASIQVPTTVGTIESDPEDRVVPPCQSEDSTNCYWDAATMGNGIGDSFVNWDGVYYYAR